MDMACGDCCIKVGSYSRVQSIRYYLLVALKEYLEIYTTSALDPINDDKIVYLCELIGADNIVHYHKYSFKKEYLFIPDELNGFFPFIFHLLDENGTMSSDEAKRFTTTFDIVNQSIKPNLKPHLENDKKLIVFSPYLFLQINHIKNKNFAFNSTSESYSMVAFSCQENR